LLDHTSVQRDLLVYDNQAGFDEIYMNGGHVGRNTDIQTGVLNDKIAISEYSFGRKLSIETGGGDDTVTLGEYVDPPTHAVDKSAQYSVHAGSVAIDLGAGDDSLTVNNLYGAINFNGGTGTDSLTHDDGQNVGASIGTTGFEKIDGLVQHVIVSSPKKTTTPLKHA
jgi:hypothetical protein